MSEHDRARAGRATGDASGQAATPSNTDLAWASHLSRSGQAAELRASTEGAPVQRQPAMAAGSAADFGRRQQAAELNGSGETGLGEAPGQAGIASPVPPMINKAGFIDHSDGANIRTGPAESGGEPVTAAPVPPATRVFVSGRHPDSADWLYVTATLPGAIVRGYTQHFRVTTDLPEPAARLHQVAAGDTAEALAVEMFKAHVEPGRDLRFYENVLLAVNQRAGRDGVRGTFQNPNLVGGGANNVQLVAGKRIWLVSAPYALSLEGDVPDGSLTGGAVANARATVAHIDDLITSVTQAPQFVGEVAGEYAGLIREHLTEIIGFTAAFIAAETASFFLAISPTGVGQAAAALIQLALAAFGATAAVQAAVGALEHAERWLTTAWTAKGEPELLAEASREFVRMLVQVALAALAAMGVRANLGRGLTIADALTITPPSIGMSPSLALAGGGTMPGGLTITPGSIATTGPVAISPVPASGGYLLSKSLGGGGGSAKNTVDDILEGTTPGPKTKGRTTQVEKPGGFDQANKDFDALGLSDVRPIDGGGRVGKLPDGRTVIVRPQSTHGAPTLEVQAGKNKIKIRYMD